jgi:Sulfotransferase family
MRGDEAQENGNYLNRLFTCNAVPLRYLVIPKCGCTFVKNLIWRIDQGQPYHNPSRIHDVDSKFKRASDRDLRIIDVAVEEYAFVVLRNPVDRFLSLYFDKVIGDGRRNFVDLGGSLERGHGVNLNPTTDIEHRKNCHILINWLDENINDGNDLPKDSHWTPQVYRRDVISKFRLKVLLLEKLDFHISMLASDIIPDLGSLLLNLERYSTNSKAFKSRIVDLELRRRINSVYSKDRKIYEHFKHAWEVQGPTSGREIPRWTESTF